MKIFQTVRTILAIIGLVAIGILTGSFLFRKKSTTQTDDAEKAKEEKKNEIESTSAADLVASSSKATELCAVKDEIKSDFQKRIRDRLVSELHRLGSGNLAADFDRGSGLSN